MYKYFGVKGESAKFRESSTYSNIYIYIHVFVCMYIYIYITSIV